MKHVFKYADPVKTLFKNAFLKMVYFNPNLGIPASATNEMNQFPNDEELHALMYQFTRQKLERGQYLQKRTEGLETDKMWIVESGQLEVFTDTSFT